MNSLRAYLKSLPDDDARIDFATRCGTTLGYLRKAMSIKQQFGESLCINMERESGGAVACEDMRADVDWAYIRQSTAPPPVAESPP
ncbi:MAG: hypothetical protein JWN23_611 [Rhodocyclales bacterium]|nr:hypothetical protein [Rhodocyclales bacterium]